VLVVHDALTDDTTEGRAAEAVVEALYDLDVEVVPATTEDDATAALRSDPGIDLVVADWDLGGEAGSVAGFITAVRARSDRLPVWLMAERTALGDVPTGIVTEVDEYVYLLDDTPGWIAGRLRDAAAKYRRQSLPAMFAALMAFAETHEYSWHTPGHEGGAAFRKSPAGRAFFDFFGEQTFRSDLSISVGELGSLLDHSGPIGQAERDAARIFNADMTLFVTNGTSTSNRVVHQACVCAGDVVVDDRNAHKSSEQADTITHAIPVYMLPTRNRYGIIGPIPPGEMTEEAIAARIEASPLAPDGAKPVLAMVTNSTYDGLLYHVPTVEQTLGTHVDRIHFDEAWYGYAAFNPIYDERHAMHRGAREDGPTTFATQSTHKLLAALSQASYIHVRNGRAPITMPRLNEAFMMHASTSPLYAIIASNDVAAKMMEGRGGLVLTTESIREAVAFRKAVARVGRGLGSDWFFHCWQPDVVADPRTLKTMPFEEAPDDLLVDNPAPWLLREGETWHGFDGLPDGYAMLDPIKVTVLTPGMGDDGRLESWGIPAALVTAYLDQHASIVVEKTQDFSILFLFSMGATKGKWGSLLTTLSDFKRDFDANAPLERALPALVAAYPRKYGSMGLADLATAMHETMRATAQMDALQAAFGTLPRPEMQNSDAFAHVVRGTVEPVKLDDAAERVSALGIVPYPPGIPLLMPGESLGAADGPFMAYLKALQEFDRRFPGFEHDLHGVEHEDGSYVLTLVKEG
jgi:lysine decarboxylase/arginine decarboxylase